jgi:hypothetical protein
MSNYNIVYETDKKKYMPLKKLDLNTAELIKDEWHHAIISYFDLKPKYNGHFSDIKLNNKDIENIKKCYGIVPPLNYLIEKQNLSPLKVLDFYSQEENSNIYSRQGKLINNYNTINKYKNII